MNTSEGQDWETVPIPAAPTSGFSWELETELSDGFDYNVNVSDRSGQGEFDSRWIPRKPDGWLGPGATYFNPSNYFVENSVLTIFGSRVPQAQQVPSNTDPGFVRNTYTSYITSRETLSPGIYTEIRMKGGGTPLSSNFWLLDDKNETEIDVVEVYGDGSWFPFNPSINVHFHRRGGVGVGNLNEQDHHARRGTKFADTWHRYGVFWKTETELDFYYDGDLVRTLDLAEEIVDPTGQYLIEPMRLIMDLEAHAWRGEDRIPTDAELLDWSINNMQVDWVRTYRLQEDLAVNPPTCNANTLGDIDGNGQVGFADFLILSRNFGTEVETPAEGDIDCNGSVGFADFLVLSENFGEIVAAHPVPEPSSFALLFVMSLFLAVSQNGVEKPKA